MTTRMFPIMSTGRERRTIPAPVRLTQIPWAFIAPHEAQAQKNHDGQTLERLAERGGLSALEALSVVKDQPFPYPQPDDVLKVQLELSGLALDFVLREAMARGAADAAAVERAKSGISEPKGAA